MAGIRGKIKKLLPDKGYGFITPFDGSKKDVFIPPDQLPEGAQVGDDVEFDREKGSKGPVAQNIVIITSSQSGHTGNQSGKAKSKDVRHDQAPSWTFGETRKDGTEQELPAYIQTRAGAEVRLKADDADVDQPAEVLHAGADGMVYFLVMLTADATHCNLLATIDGKHYSRLWEAKKASKEQKPFLHIRKVRSADGEATFELITTETEDAKSKKVPTTIMFELTSGLNFSYRKDGEANWIEKTPRGSIYTDGTLKLGIRLETLPQGKAGDYALFNDDSKPQYISALETAVRMKGSHV